MPQYDSLWVTRPRIGLIATADTAPHRRTPLIGSSFRRTQTSAGAIAPSTACTKNTPASGSA